MRIDNSAARAWWFCPMKYWEEYVAKIEWDYSGMEKTPKYFGHRMHEVLENHYRELAGMPMIAFDAADEIVEAEAQVAFEAYKLHYPDEPFTVMDTERLFEVPLHLECEWCNNQPLTSCGISGIDKEIQTCNECGLDLPPAKHTYSGKMDMLVRMKDTGKLWLLDHKTQKRTAYTNNPEAWAAKAQVGLYKWAAEQLYKEPIDGIILNVIRRQSDKGLEPPTFWRDNLERSSEQVDEALRNIIWVADQIEGMHKTFGDGPNWPTDRDNCKQGNFKCDFYDLHVLGRTDANLAKFREKVPYLDL